MTGEPAIQAITGWPRLVHHRGLHSDHYVWRELPRTLFLALPARGASLPAKAPPPFICSIHDKVSTYDRNCWRYPGESSRISESDRCTRLLELSGPAFPGTCSSDCRNCLSVLTLDQVSLKKSSTSSSGQEGGRVTRLPAAIPSPSADAWLAM